MDFGLHVPAMGPDSDDIDHIRDFAVTAEAVGFRSLWCGDHVVIPAAYESQHVTNSRGRYHWSHQDNFIEQITLLSFIAGVTRRIDIGTSIFVLPQRNPVVAAKQLASLEHLSEGRLHVGLGVGWLQEEYDVLGVPFKERGRRFDEHLALLERVMSGDDVTFDGAYTRIKIPMGFQPTPGPARRLPFYIASGGKGRVSDAALRRLVKVAGFMTAHEPPDVVADVHENQLQPAWQAAGRTDELKIVARAPIDLDASSTSLIELFHRYESAGVTTFVLDNRTIDTRDGRPAPLRHRFARFIDEILPEFPPHQEENVDEGRRTLGPERSPASQVHLTANRDEVPACTAIVE